jgi:hypothetical protein
MQVVGLFLESGTEEQHRQIQALARQRPDAADKAAVTAIIATFTGSESA